MKDISKYIYLCGHALGLLNYIKDDLEQLREYLKFYDTTEADIQKIQNTFEDIRGRLHNGNN